MENTSYWLMKTEPSTYSFEQLLKDQKTNWNGVRNFQARNNLKAMAKGDMALIYHSGDDKAVVGIAQIACPAYSDPVPGEEGWVQVDIKPIQAFKKPISLKEIKATQSLSTLPLIKQSRLSVMPITREHYETLVKLGTQR